MSIQEHASNARCVRNFRYLLIQFQYQVDISGRCLDLCLQLLFPWKVLLLMCGVNFVAKQQTTVAVVYTSSMFLDDGCCRVSLYRVLCTYWTHCCLHIQKLPSFNLSSCLQTSWPLLVVSLQSLVITVSELWASSFFRVTRDVAFRSNHSSPHSPTPPPSGVSGVKAFQHFPVFTFSPRMFYTRSPFLS